MSLIPDVEFRREQKDLELYLDPDHVWPVTKSDCVRVYISFRELSGFFFFNEWDDPSVGLHVPQKWKGLKRFITEVKDHKPPGFSDWTEDEENLDLSVPIWRNVDISKFATNDTFDTKGFYRELSRSVKALIAKKSAISAIIRKINT